MGEAREHGVMETKTSTFQEEESSVSGRFLRKLQFERTLEIWMGFGQGFPCSSVGKESACNAGDLGSIPGSGRTPGERNGNLLQYSCLENPMDRGAWQVTVYGVARVRHDLVTTPPPLRDEGDTSSPSPCEEGMADRLTSIGGQRRGL